MDQHTLLMRTLGRQPSFDSPEIARRREQLLVLERDAREMRRRRRRERVRLAWNALVALRRTGSDHRVRPLGDREPGQALR